MSALQRMEHTREALIDALQVRDWQAIGALDLACRACVESVLSEESCDEAQLRENLEGLLSVYRQLVEIAKGERLAIAAEMSQLKQAQKATRVYHMFC